jgi:hypothetical protein
MEKKPLSEKKGIEVGTAEGFLHLYNAERGTSFRVVRHADSPDIECEDRDGRRLNLEITLTEDRPRDIQALFGRSAGRSVEALRAHVEDARASEAHPLDYVSSLTGNVAAALTVRLRSKFRKRYGAHTALVVRDCSGVDWDWELPDIRVELASEINPFDEGVWIVNRTKDRLFRLF